MDEKSTTTLPADGDGDQIKIDWIKIEKWFLHCRPPNPYRLNLGHCAKFPDAKPGKPEEPRREAEPA